MRKIIFVLLLTVLFGASAQARARSGQTAIVQINHQKTLSKSKLTIKFVSLEADSRCPTDVQCVYAGNARIIIEIKKACGKAKTFQLNTPLNPQSVNFAGYTIRLTALNPSPATNIRIDRNGYTATFDITRLAK